MSTPITTAYATDEDIAVRFPSDYALLCPRGQLLASGLDGSFSASSRWTLQSASVDFAANGLTPGMVVQLLGPTAALGAGGDVLVVDSASPGGLVLRRGGLAVGQGQPPAPAAGLTGVEFVVTTLAPQIQVASTELNRRFGIDDQVPGRRSLDLADARELRDATVLTAVLGRYLDLIQDANGVTALKARLIKAQLDELLGRLALHWNSAEPTTRFGTKMAR